MSKFATAWKLTALTFAGGALGSAARFFISTDMPQELWLWVVNLLGTLLLGYVQVNRAFESKASQSFWATGFAGGFTTLSALITFQSFGGDSTFVYLAAQIALGLTVYWIGRILGGERPWSKS